MKPTWILKDCEQEALENTLNDLDLGYVPWELRYIDVQDPQDSVNQEGLSAYCTEMGD